LTCCAELLSPEFLSLPAGGTANLDTARESKDIQNWQTFRDIWGTENRTEWLQQRSYDLTLDEHVSYGGDSADPAYHL